MNNGKGQNGTRKKRPLVRVWEPIFLEALEQTGNISISAKRADVGRQTAYRRKEAYEQFSEAWDDAIETAIDTMVEEARRRAVEGTAKPVIYKGLVAHHIQEYSDVLLMFLLKAHRPKVYRETINQRISGEDGGPLRLTMEAKDFTDDELAAIARKDSARCRC